MTSAMLPLSARRVPARAAFTLLACAVLAAGVAAGPVGCVSTADRDFGSFGSGDLVRVKRTSAASGPDAGRAPGPAALDGLVGSLRSGEAAGCVWEAYLTNLDPLRAVRATVVRTADPDKGAKTGARYTVDVPPTRAVPLGCTKQSGADKDTYFLVVDAAFVP